jgi:hypothetical protein
VFKTAFSLSLSLLSKKYPRINNAHGKHRYAFTKGCFFIDCAFRVFIEFDNVANTLKVKIARFTMMT